MVAVSLLACALAAGQIGTDAAPKAEEKDAAHVKIGDDMIQRVVAAGDRASIGSSPSAAAAESKAAVRLRRLCLTIKGSQSPAVPQRRLILTSDGLTSRALEEQFHRMLGRPTAQATLWYIPTAVLHNGVSEAQATRMLRAIQRQLGLGRVAMIDPEHVRGDALRCALQGLGPVDVVWAEWGNTYALRHYLRTSGADDVVRGLVDGGALYVGSSAGAIVTGRTVQTAFWKNWDDPTVGGSIDVNWADSEVGRGLDLAGGRSIFPHARPDSPYGNREWQDAQAVKYGHTDHDVVRLNDGEGFVIDGDRAFIVH